MDDEGDYRVFVVEDSPLLGNFLIERLRASSLAVAGRADNPKDALAGIAATRPDVVIIDLMLRSGSGLDVLRALQRRNGGHHPVRMVLTNYSQTPYRELTRRYGADYFFDKAKDINLLVETLASLMARANRRNGSDHG